jgi:hypothetical protein
VTDAAAEAVRDAATDSVTFAFGDTRAQLYGLARLGIAAGSRDARSGSALALIYAGREPVAAHARSGLPVAADASWEAIELDGLGTSIDAPLDRWRLRFDGRDGQGFDLVFEALGAAAELAPAEPAARLGGMAGYDQPCRVSGRVRAGGREQSVACLGQRGHSWGDADWGRIELARTVCAWTDRGCAALTAIRPAGAGSHGSEATWAAVWEPAGVLAVEDARLSTTYDTDGHARRAGLELWPADSEWPRRAAGEVLCGSSLELGALRLDTAFFRWHLEGVAGVGRYDIVRRAA